MNILTEDFTTVAGAQACAARLIAARVQFTFSHRDGALSISYPEPETIVAAPPPSEPEPPRPAA